MSTRGSAPGRAAADALDELIESVAALRGELARRFPPERTRAAGAGGEAEGRAGLGWLEMLGKVDPVRRLERLRRRLPWPDPADVSTKVDAFGLDAQYLERSRPLLDFLYERWWRITVSGTEQIPAAPRLIFVANSSGLLPWDALMLAHAVERVSPGQRRPRPLVSDHVMTRPFLPPVLARLGAVRAHPENAERLLERDEWVIAFPEGRRGALKPFAERYRLQRFGRGSFVRLALRKRASLVPVAIVGAEETHPILRRWESAALLLGVEVPLTPTFPWLGPLGLVPLPSQWRIRFGAPLDLGQVDPARAEEDGFVAQTREHVRSAIRALLGEELERRYSVWS